MALFNRNIEILFLFETCFSDKSFLIKTYMDIFTTIFHSNTICHFFLAKMDSHDPLKHEKSFKMIPEVDHGN